MNFTKPEALRIVPLAVPAIVRRDTEVSMAALPDLVTVTSTAPADSATLKLELSNAKLTATDKQR